MKKLMTIAASALVLALSQAAQAQTYWSSNGGGCVPEDPSITSALYSTVTGGMRVKFKAGKTGTIKLVCPVNVPVRNASVMEMYYQDPDGYGTAYQVKASLRSVRYSNGAYATVCTADSHASGGSPTGMWSRKSCSLPSPLNPDQYHYWVEVEISSTATQRTVEFNVARLTYIIP